MAAPKGNKYAVGANNGRLREHDRDEIARKLVEWALQDDSINLCKFCAMNFIVPSKISQWASEEEDFRKAYEFAKACIGARREEMLNNQQLHVKSYDLNAKTYDYFLKKEHMEQMEYEAKVKAKELNAVTTEQTQSYIQMMNHLDELRKKMSQEES